MLGEKEIIESGRSSPIVHRTVDSLSVEDLKVCKQRVDPQGYIRVYYNKREYYLHRLLYQIYHKCSLLKRAIVHHINGNRQDNRKCNLMAMLRNKHTSKLIHGDSHLGFKHSEESKQKMREHVRARSRLNLEKMWRRKPSQRRDFMRHSSIYRRFAPAN